MLKMNWINNRISSKNTPITLFLLREENKSPVCIQGQLKANSVVFYLLRGKLHSVHMHPVLSPENDPRSHFIPCPLSENSAHYGSLDYSRPFIIIGFLLISFILCLSKGDILKLEMIIWLQYLPSWSVSVCLWGRAPQASLSITVIFFLLSTS